MKKDKPILLALRSGNSYLDPNASILLLPNGDILCADVKIKGHPQTNHYYSIIAQYLKKKRLKFDVSRFKEMDLGDIVEDMQSRKVKSISLKKLIEIYSRRNSICRLRDHKIDHIKSLAYKRFWRKRRKLLKENKNEEANRLYNQFLEKEKIINKLINN
jgi:hypothetical protein